MSLPPKEKLAEEKVSVVPSKIRVSNWCSFFREVKGDYKNTQ